MVGGELVPVTLTNLSNHQVKLFNYSAEISPLTHDDQSSQLPQIDSYADLADYHTLGSSESEELWLTGPQCSSHNENSLAHSYYFVVAQENDQLNFFAGWPEEYQALNNVDAYGFMWVDPGGTRDVPANANIPTSIEFVVSAAGEVAMVVN